MVCLIKPQFDAGREEVGKKGVVRDKAVHLSVIRKVADYAKSLGFSLKGLDYSPIRGPEGNIEYLLYIRKSDEESINMDEVYITNIINSAHDELDR